jgi:Arm DNA-binding domain
MVRKIGKLSPVGVRNETKPGLYSDGGGLNLNVGPSGGKSWLFRFMLNGTAREMGLGPVHTIGLAEARERAKVGPSSSAGWHRPDRRSAG